MPMNLRHEPTDLELIHYWDHPVFQAIKHRLSLDRHKAEVEPFTPDQIDAAIGERADFVGRDIEEIGSSDVSIWVRQVLADLQRSQEAR